VTSPIKIESHRMRYSCIFADSLTDLAFSLRDSAKYDAIIVDTIVAYTYSEFISSIADSTPLIRVSVDASTKHISNLLPTLDILSSLKLQKSSTILLIGGATLQDIYATAAALYSRGLSWIFVPTTLLAQADSCIGSKTSIDSTLAKNQYGVFYPPASIHICSEFLHTLPHEEILSGIGDLYHYIAPYNISDQFISLVRSNYADKHSLINVASSYTHASLSIKSELISIDEFDLGPRSIFNYGHTYGHALEKATDGYLPHGVAVKIGILIALSSSMSCYDTTRTLSLLESVIDAYVLQYKSGLLPVSKAKFLDAISRDKKNLSRDIVSAIHPCPVEKSLWTSSLYSPTYGLHRVTLSAQQALILLESYHRIVLIP
jgi:3-dehydroquinate synthase